MMYYRQDTAAEIFAIIFGSTKIELVLHSSNVTTKPMQDRQINFTRRRYASSFVPALHPDPTAADAGQ
jgi:hypothetical protein